jgi:hypothetical protein
MAHLHKSYPWIGRSPVETALNPDRSLDGEWSHELLLNLYTQSSHGAAPLAPKLYVHKDLSALTLLSLVSLRRVFDNMFTILK